MTNSNIVAFYSDIRKDPAIIAHLSEAKSEDALVERIKGESAKRGFALSDADIKQGFDHLDEIFRQAAGDDELTEKELEIVSGGTSFSAFVEYSNEQRGKKWGSYETGSNGQVYYFNSTGCRTDKDTFLKMNA
jgi:hypothetical protein